MNELSIDIRQNGNHWVFTVEQKGGRQEYLCGSEKQARRLEELFRSSQRKPKRA